jgi:myo-inositol-1(or 4)-monophosphatase
MRGCRGLAPNPQTTIVACRFSLDVLFSRHPVAGSVDIRPRVTTIAAVASIDAFCSGVRIATCRMTATEFLMTSAISDNAALQTLWLEAAIRAARAGGAVLQDWLGRFAVREKSRANLVTDADEASQRAIVATLRDQFPDHGFLGEEGLDEPSRSGAPCWIIDPLDGTTNYVHGFPYYCVSVAVALGRQVEAGVIYDPSRDELFTAVRGGGANRNGVTIRTSGETSPGAAMAVASLPVATDPENPAIRRFLTGLQNLQTVQRTGSAALNLAYLACGRIDAFWSSSLHAWDVAAGTLLVTESGGHLTNLAGGACDIFVPSLLAASTVQLNQQLVHLLR